MGYGRFYTHRYIRRTAGKAVGLVARYEDISTKWRIVDR